MPPCAVRYSSKFENFCFGGRRVISSRPGSSSGIWRGPRLIRCGWRGLAGSRGGRGGGGVSGRPPFWRGGCCGAACGFWGWAGPRPRGRGALPRGGCLGCGAFWADEGACGRGCPCWGRELRAGAALGAERWPGWRGAFSAAGCWAAAAAPPLPEPRRRRRRCGAAGFWVGFSIVFSILIVSRLRDIRCSSVFLRRGPC